MIKRPSMHYEVKQDYVLLQAEGIVDNFSKLLMGTQWMYGIIEKTQAKKVLLDYQNVDFKLDQAEAFNIVKIYEQEMPLMSEVKLATLVNSKTSNLGKVWEEISIKRYFDFALFTDFSRAERWLISSYSTRNR